MRVTFAKRSLRQRIIALGAAYTIALASLVANFGAARAAADAIAQPDNAICHSVVADQPASSPDGTGNAVCADCCCIGCLTMAAAVPPPLAAAAVPRAFSRWRAPLTRFGVLDGAKFNSHRPRGPPQAL
ncbi:MAG TPA: hypothetical protein VFN27_16445 [Xanthobacteraceae bacterium]|nr:hypothetical protein [Xanthobacteraceae bacterium]